MAPEDKPATAPQGEELPGQSLAAQIKKEQVTRASQAKDSQSLALPIVPAPAKSSQPLAGDGQSANRDVLPPNFIEAIAALTKSTDNLKGTYTTSLNHLIKAVEEVQKLSKKARSQNARLIKSIQITQGKSEEVNEKTIKSLSLLIGKYAKEPDKKRSIKQRFLEDTIEGQIFNSNIARKLTRRRSQEQEKADAEKADFNPDTNVNVNTDAQKEAATFVKSKNDKIAAPNSDVDADENVETGGEALKNTPLQSVKVMEYGDRAIDQLRQLFNINPKLTGKSDADGSGGADGGGGSGLLGLLGAGGAGAFVSKLFGKKAAQAATDSAVRRSTVATAKSLKNAGKIAGKVARGAGPIGTAITIAEGTGTAYGGYTDAAEQVESGKITKDEGTVKKSQAIGTGTGQAAGGIAGVYAGGLAGAAIGSAVVPVIGTAIGGLLGMAIGGWLGSEGGEIVGEKVGTAVGKTIIEKPVVAESIKKSLTPPTSVIKSNVEATGLEVATPVATPVADKPLSSLVPVKPALVANSSNTGKVGGSADVAMGYQYDQPQFIASNLSLRAIAEDPDDYKAAQTKRQDPFAAAIEVTKFSPAAKSMVQPVVSSTPAVKPSSAADKLAPAVKPAPTVNTVTDKSLNPMSVAKSAPEANLAPIVTLKTTPTLKPREEVTTFRAAAVTMPLPAAAKSLAAGTKSSTTNVDQSTPKTKSTDGFTNFVAPKSIPFTNNNTPVNSNKAAASQYDFTTVRGEPDYIKKPGTLLGDRFGNNAQALPVPSLISLIPPVTSTESSINPNIIELNQSMRGLAAAFAKRSPDTESDGITSISSNNSSVNNTNNSFSDSVERDVIYMDRNKTRKQNAYRGDFF